MTPRELYEHACWNYLMLVFGLAPLLENRDGPFFSAASADIRAAAEDMRRKRVVLVATTV